MANAGALINEGLWRRDKEFQRLPRLAQCTFCQVLSQKDLDTAGVLTLHLELLVTGCGELTVEQLRADLAVLEKHRFVFVDYDTYELFVRSYVRQVSSKNRNSWSSVPKNARLIGSSKIRRELAAELRRLRRKDADELAAEIDPNETPSGPGSDGVSTGSDGVETGSGPGTPSGRGLDGDSSVLVLVQDSCSVVGHLGERPHCPDHPNENSTGKCRWCMLRRQWDESNAVALKADELETKRRERERVAACPDCHGTHLIDVGDNAVAKCSHPNLETGHA